MKKYDVFELIIGNSIRKTIIDFFEDLEFEDYEICEYCGSTQQGTDVLLDYSDEIVGIEREVRFCMSCMAPWD